MFLNLVSSRVNKLSIFDLIHIIKNFFPREIINVFLEFVLEKRWVKKCGFSLRFNTSNACLDPPLLIHVFANNFLTLSFYHLHVKVYSVRANSIKSTFNFLTQIWYFGTDQTPTFQHFLFLQKESRKLF